MESQTWNAYTASWAFLLMLAGTRLHFARTETCIGKLVTADPEGAALEGHTVLWGRQLSARQLTARATGDGCALPQDYGTRLMGALCPRTMGRKTPAGQELVPLGLQECFLAPFVHTGPIPGSHPFSNS